MSEESNVWSVYLLFLSGKVEKNDVFYEEFSASVVRCASVVPWSWISLEFFVVLILG